eukprot:TRINITY_DN18297_c0_g1_i7.p1 TRINITY_DN18297_c0_g1~~TRINITY_DN18297_c0_g1_i7.p1  ORF type:complete len:146 (-),score=30.90 TRINITY_DN18297_c0_g1_i7:205-642(-)
MDLEIENAEKIRQLTPRAMKRPVVLYSSNNVEELRQRQIGILHPTAFPRQIGGTQRTMVSDVSEATSVGLAHLQQGRKDVEKVREDKEWEATQTTKALSREGPLGKFVKPSNKQLDLERELKTLQEKTDINNFEYKKIPRPSKLE